MKALIGMSGGVDSSVAVYLCMQEGLSCIGGTMLLGISNPVIKAHGSSGDYAFRSAILQAARAVKSGICDDIAGNIDDIKAAVQ